MAGSFSNGTKAAETELILENPLGFMTAECAAHDGGGEMALIVAYRLKIPLPSGGVKVTTTDGVRLDSRMTNPRLDTSKVNEMLLELPRVRGTYKVTFWAFENSALREELVHVQQGPNDPPYSLRLLDRNQQPAQTDALDGVGALALAPGSSFDVQCGGLLREGDQVVLVRASDGHHDNEGPSPKQLQQYTAAFNLDLSTGRASVKLPTEISKDQKNMPQIFYICLALHHHSGAFLCGDFGIVMMTSKGWRLQLQQLRHHFAQ